MITLTTPRSVLSVLGGTATVSYDKMVISPMVHDVISQKVSGSIYLTSTTTPDMQPIVGDLVIDVPASKLEIQVKQLDFYRRITLTGPQNTAVIGYIQSAQNNLENGLISLGLVSGTQSTGA